MRYPKPYPNFEFRENEARGNKQRRLTVDNAANSEQIKNMRHHRVGHWPDIIEELDYALGVAMVGRWTGIEISLRRDRFDELRHYSKRPMSQTYRGYRVRLIDSPNQGVTDRVSGFIGTNAQSENLPPYEHPDRVAIPQIRMEDLAKMAGK